MSEPNTPLPSDSLRFDALKEAITSRDDVVEQQQAGGDTANITLGSLLGVGSFGAVYKCTLQLGGDGSTQRLAIKVPGRKNGDMRRAMLNFEKEFTNAELLLEPALVRSLPRRPGDPLPRLSGAEYFRVLAARCRHAAHVGYAFLHRPIHYASDIRLPTYGPYPIPAILSEPADGDLSDLVHTSRSSIHARLRVMADGTPSPLWTVVAWQVLRGVDFINSVCGLSHIDLKDKNVFFRGDPDKPTSLFRCLIGDFGMLEPRERILQAENYPLRGMEFFHGSYEFTPPVLDHQPTQISCALFSDFECLSTLLVALVFTPPSCRGVPWSRGQYGHVVGCTAQQMRDPLDSEYFARIASPPVRTLLDFCANVEGMTAWEPLSDICWRQLLPQVEALLVETLPEVFRAYTERADAYARDADEAARHADALESIYHGKVSPDPKPMEQPSADLMALRLEHLEDQRDDTARSLSEALERMRLVSERLRGAVVDQDVLHQLGEAIMVVEYVQERAEKDLDARHQPYPHPLPADRSSPKKRARAASSDDFGQPSPSAMENWRRFRNESPRYSAPSPLPPSSPPDRRFGSESPQYSALSPTYNPSSPSERARSTGARYSPPWQGMARLWPNGRRY